MKKLLSGVLLLGMLAPLFAFAKTYYVSDELWVNLRSGPGQDYRIIRVLKSGNSLEFIEQNEEADWMMVKTSRGEEGWIPLRYLTETPIAKQLLATTTAELENVKAELNATKENLTKASSSASNSGQEVSALKSEKDQLAKELAEIKAISADAINLQTNNQQLLEENQSLKNQIDVLTVENQTLEDQANTEQWIVGAVILGVGLLLGLIIPRMRSSKSNSWA